MPGVSDPATARHVAASAGTSCAGSPSRGAPSAASGYDVSMQLHDAHQFVASLERDLGPESIYKSSVVNLIADLQEETYRSTDEREKVRLASLELRARLILDRWRKREVN